MVMSLASQLRTRFSIYTNIYQYIPIYIYSRQRRGAPHTKHGLGVKHWKHLLKHITHTDSGHDEKRPTEKFASSGQSSGSPHAKHKNSFTNHRFSLASAA